MIKDMPSKNIEYICIHNILTDILLGISNKKTFEDITDAIKSLGFKPAFITLNPVEANKIIPKKTTILTKTKVKSINYNLIPIKLINPIAIRPVMIKVIPNPFKGSGILEYAIFSLMAEIARIAKKKPTPDPKP